MSGLVAYWLPGLRAAMDPPTARCDTVAMSVTTEHPNRELPFFSETRQEIQPGLTVALTDYAAQDAVSGSMESPGDSEFIHLNCILEGRFQACIRDVRMQYGGGDLSMGYSDGEVFSMPVGQRFRNLAVMATPDKLWELAGDELTVLRLADRPRFFVRNAGYHLDVARQAEQLAIRLSQGGDSRLRLHAAVLDYLHWLLSAFREPAAAVTTISERDRRRLYLARDRLLSDLSQPPTLAELASETGLNQYKLKNGFRALFGTSVYALFQQQRMQAARALLRRHNVTETAVMMGYSNVSHFSAAFRKQFGVLPRDLRG
ncbi:helix-turn-helix transcriptional regulator [Marinobacter xestospongiae]|uniref:AraC family transcriptional regulator n=1 Tax=Marinobacter xestospongiae TaxID=994319 RepID=A0ABU3VW87_9GAMM|nr:AraC family transcriptional regulator [Marinobacter xestospongiae]MDV2078535.1 AraC family transcriptional regulator [Marinobacter xestospongiae]